VVRKTFHAAAVALLACSLTSCQSPLILPTTAAVDRSATNLHRAAPSFLPHFQGAPGRSWSVPIVQATFVQEVTREVAGEPSESDGGVHGQGGWEPVQGRQETAPDRTRDAQANAYPIDLPTALRLAGAENLDIKLAQAVLQEAAAREQMASVLWYPTVRLGTEYIKHDGRLQETVGPILEVSRNSGFIGGGLFAELDVAEALYAPLAARQLASAVQSRVESVRNEVLLNVARAYFDLVEAELRRITQEQVVRQAEELARLTQEFARTGQGLESDAQRAAAELERQRAELALARERVRVASANLARLLRLDPAVQLVPANAPVGPLHLIRTDAPLETLVQTALARRPEVHEQTALVQQALARLRQEQLRAYLPELNLGVSAGGYGGGEGSHFGNFSDRSDVTIGAFWSWRNLGAGEDAARKIESARVRQAELSARRLADEIARQVVVAYHRLQERRLQVEAAHASLQAARKSLELNLRRIRGAEGLPIEALDALRALARAQNDYLAAVAAYNRAQFELAWATGQPLEHLLTGPRPE